MVLYISVMNKTPAGRFNEKPTTGLSEQLENLILKLGD